MIDQLAKQYGEEHGKEILVLRTPVAYCELNPIEMVWAQVKRYIKVNNGAVDEKDKAKFTLKNVMELGREAFKKVTPEDWRKYYTHVVEKVEEGFLATSDAESGFIFRFEDEDSSDDDDSDDSLEPSSDED